MTTTVETFDFVQDGQAWYCPQTKDRYRTAHEAYRSAVVVIAEFSRWLGGEAREEGDFEMRIPEIRIVFHPKTDETRSVVRAFFNTFPKGKL